MKPYLIIPELVEQPTWGGDYILKLKNWQNKTDLQNKKIGQSYELYGESLLANKIFDSTDLSFSSTLSDYIHLSDLINKNPSEILGEKIYTKYKSMPLLIKLNQARGNSFQLHIKPGQHDDRWKPKPESWYFLEDGYISCGIKKETNITAYKEVCVNIEEKMRELSREIMQGNKNIDMARQEAQKYIRSQNPWQFVNVYKTNKFDLIDLSEGGVHHSWEENPSLPLGNIVYEVQMDVMDEFCTIRGFDQGKIKDDGTIREIHVEDYLKYMDTSNEMNDITHLKRTRIGDNLLQTPYYSLDIVEVTNKTSVKIQDSFQHLYVQEGDIEVISVDGAVRLTTGHSCFIPFGIKEYDIKTNLTKSIVLKTYIKP
jgi:mannose-6-phosphate isomerase class I